MRRAWIVSGVIALLATFLLGFWPQWSQRRRVERELATTRAAFEQTQEQLRVCRLQNRLVTIVLAAQGRNLGIAAEQAQIFLAELDTLSAVAAPATRAVLERARPRAKDMVDIARRLDPQVPEDLTRAASELSALLGAFEQPAPRAAATP